MKRESAWPLGTLLLTLAIVLGERSGLLPAAWWVWPWGASLVLFGLPHGAIDHEVALGLWRPSPWSPKWTMGAILVSYVSVGGLVMLGWFIAPAAIFFGFILLTWAHWGLADLWWSWRRDRGYFRGRAHRAIFALWRGALPMLVPLAADPLPYRHTAEVTCNLFLRNPSEFAWIESTTVRAVCIGLVIFLGLLDFALTRRSSQTRWLNAAEGGALLVFFGTLPALVTVGFYFAFWHGLRHVLRLMNGSRLSWSKFTLRALPSTLASLCFLGTLALILGRKHAHDEALGVYLALIAALTVPHAIVVTLMDRKDGLWNPLKSSEPTPFPKEAAPAGS